MTKSSDTRIAAPVAPRRSHSFTTHGITVTDDYAWLKDAKWQEVLRDPARLDPDIRSYLEAENRYTETILGPTASRWPSLRDRFRPRGAAATFGRRAAQAE